MLRRAVRMCRSTQLTETLSFPPTNHFACGGFQSSTLSHFLNHSSFVRLLRPEASGFAVGSLVDRRIGDERVAPECVRRRKFAVFGEEGVDFVHVVRMLVADLVMA